MINNAQIAVLNDRKRFCSRASVSVINTAVSMISDGESLIDGLNEISQTRQETEKGALADEMISRLEEVDINRYQKYINELQRTGQRQIIASDEDYPEHLSKIENPPLCIYTDGNLSAAQHGVTIVGTRSATDHRIEVAEQIAIEVVEQLGLPVISGLANGVDEAAHKGAIDADGETVGVLPDHLSNIKPSSNQNLGEKITESGCLLAEVSKFAGFHKGRYLERNRITSGLADAVVVAASKDSGGTIAQAELAAQQGKPRFIYDSEKGDSQTPEQLVEDLGFQTFHSVDSLIRMISDAEPQSSDSSGNMTFDNF